MASHTVIPISILYIDRNITSFAGIPSNPGINFYIGQKNEKKEKKNHCKTKRINVISVYIGLSHSMAIFYGFVHVFSI